MTTTSVPTSNTAAFYLQAVVAFGAALVAVGTGIAYLPVDAWVRAFLATGTLFLVSSCFTLAKCVRDQQENVNARARVEEARLEKLMVEHDPYARV